MDEHASGNVGIAGVGSYLPERSLDAWEAVRGSGIPREKFDKIGARRLHVAAEGETPSSMAVEASRRALDDAGLGPEAVDLVVYCGSLKDHARWMASAKVQADLGCGDSFAFDLYQGCNGQNMAMRVVCALMRADPSIRTALIAAAERWDTTLERPILGHSFIFGDGASAAVLRRDAPSYRILSSACRTWGEHHETFCCPELGAASRLTPEVLARGGHLFQIYKPSYASREEIRVFGERINEVARQMLEEAVRRAGVDFGDIDFVIMINASRRHNLLFLDAVGLAGCPHTADYVAESAHLGTGDIFYNLDRVRREGRVRPGQLVAFYTGGGGYSWAVTLVRA
ncbi:MAG: hypothetical protein JXR96_07665 [Deltaproteobacteria bacterium]|nr:hypothetical protein [Deltaproteobacteria bacterium]